jgi:5-methylcytosine-specific restriction protein A
VLTLKIIHTIHYIKQLEVTIVVTELDQTQWMHILSDEALTKPKDLAVFRVMYGFEGHQAPASQIGLLLGHYKSPASPMNSRVSNYAKRIAKTYPINFNKRREGGNEYWSFFFEGFDDATGKKFIWKMKPALVAAFEALELAQEIPLTEEIPTQPNLTLTEGMKRTVTVNAYERNGSARQKCIDHWGSQCAVCKIDFAETYGAIGDGFIHVHHLVPLASIGQTYELNPVDDLRPVCPNCHAMLHKRTPPYTIAELQEIMNDHSR